MNTRQRGFTLIEMVVVVALIGILATAAHPLLELTKRRADEMALRQSLRALRQAIDAYHAAALEGRIAKRVDESGYPPTLETLVAGVPDAQNPSRRHYFMRRLPRDPFAPPGPSGDGSAASSWGLRSADSPAESPQPGADVFDVRSRSDGIALDGSAYRDW